MELYHDDRTSLAQQFTWMSILLERTKTVKESEKSRIEERFNMFDQLWNESPRVQQIKKQAKEQAEKEARKDFEQQVEQERLKLQQEAEQKIFKAKQAQQEAEQERLKIRRSYLVTLTRARFPDLAAFAQQQVEQFDQPAALDVLIQ